MSRKHFEQIAETIRVQLDGVSNYPGEVQGSVRMAIKESANRLCDVFADANPRFNRNIFLAACGIN